MSKNSPTQAPKAYENYEFLNSRAGRPLRIMSEFHEPLLRVDQYGILHGIVVFGSARVPSADAVENGSASSHEGLRDLASFCEATRKLSGRLTEWSMGLSDPG